MASIFSCELLVEFVGLQIKTFLGLCVFTSGKYLCMCGISLVYVYFCSQNSLLKCSASI